jgi:hypothetical protein
MVQIKIEGHSVDLIMDTGSEHTSSGGRIKARSYSC